MSLREIYKKTHFEIFLSVQILNIKTRTRTKSQQNQSRHMIRKSLRILLLPSSFWLLFFNFTKIYFLKYSFMFRIILCIYKTWCNVVPYFYIWIAWLILICTHIWRIDGSIFSSLSLAYQSIIQGNSKTCKNVSGFTFMTLSFVPSLLVRSQRIKIYAFSGTKQKFGTSFSYIIWIRRYLVWHPVLYLIQSFCNPSR